MSFLARSMPAASCSALSQVKSSAVRVLSDTDRSRRRLRSSFTTVEVIFTTSPTVIATESR